MKKISLRLILKIILFQLVFVAPVQSASLKHGFATRSYVKSGAMAKAGQKLSNLYNEQQAYPKGADAQAFSAFVANEMLIRVVDGHVAIDAVASGEPNVLKSDLEALGIKRAETFGVVVSGWLPISSIADIANLKSLQFVRPAFAMSNSGLVDSQGDAAMRADIARAEFDVDGSGLTVGVLSDSFNCLGGAATNVANGDLPSGISVLDDSECFYSVDEGRAMMQIIHDVAPGASLAFHTAFPAQANYAQGIIDLANAGVQVIVDDVYYLNEPMFQDGIVAQAVDKVGEDGISYFSAAHNDARESYESPFRGGHLVQVDGMYFEAHDFDPGPSIDTFQSISIPEGTELIIAFQWDSPFYSVSPGSGGSASDLDIQLLDDPPTTVLEWSINPNIGGDPEELLYYINPAGSGRTNFNILIDYWDGIVPGKMKYIAITNQGGINEYATNSSTIFGHNNAAGAEAVGAAFYLDTPEFGTSPPLLEPFSSAGGTPILFDLDGNRLANPLVRKKPGIVAPDGVNTTLALYGGSDFEQDGFPNFYGTSAAAPHAAAVAALMLEADMSLTPVNLYSVLEETAADMDDPFTLGFDEGFDFGSGYGLIQADLAISALQSNPLHDFNGDNTSDVLFQNSSDGRLLIWIMNNFVRTISFPQSLASSWDVVGKGDFNGDGTTDVLYMKDDGTTAIAEMNNATRANLAFPGGINTVWQAKGVGDFNGDGTDDILWRRSTDGVTMIWGIVDSDRDKISWPGGLASFWDVVGVGDFDNDGIDDILCQHNSDGRLLIWKMNNYSRAAVKLPQSLANTWSVVSVGDFNADGTDDVLYRKDVGDTAVAEFSSLNRSALKFPGGIGLPWSVKDVGDYDGDSSDDIFFRRASDGMTLAWGIINSVRSGIAWPGGLATQWGVQ